MLNAGSWKRVASAVRPCHRTLDANTPFIPRIVFLFPRLYILPSPLLFCFAFFSRFIFFSLLRSTAFIIKIKCKIVPRTSSPNGVRNREPPSATRARRNLWFPLIVVSLRISIPHLLRCLHSVFQFHYKKRGEKSIDGVASARQRRYRLIYTDCPKNLLTTKGNC